MLELSEEDFFAGMGRLRRAIGSVDLRTVEVIACYFAIERELDLALKAMLPRPERLKGLGYKQKVSVFLAICDDSAADDFEKPLIAFDQLRNCVAHNDKRQTSAAFRALCGAFSSIGAKLDPAETTVSGIATALIRAITMLVKEHGFEIDEE